MLLYIIHYYLVSNNFALLFSALTFYNTQVFGLLSNFDISCKLKACYFFHCSLCRHYYFNCKLLRGGISVLSTQSSSCPASTGWLCLPALQREGGISEVSYILAYPMEAGLSFTNELFHLKFYLKEQLLKLAVPQAWCCQ